MPVTVALTLAADPPPLDTAGLTNLIAALLERPWTTMLVVAAFWCAGITARLQVGSWRHRHHAAGARLVMIAAPPQVDPAGAAAFWSNMTGLLTPAARIRLRYGHPHVAFELTWTGRQLTIGVWVPGTVPPGAVEAAVRAAWPGATVTTGPPTDPIPADTGTITGGQLRPTGPHWLPLRTDHDTDPLRPLLAAGTLLRGDESGCVQILARPASRRRAHRARLAAAGVRNGRPDGIGVLPGRLLLGLVELFLPGRPTGRTATPPARRDPHTERQLRAAVDKTSQPLWDTAVRYAVAKTSPAGTDPAGRVRGVADAVASAFAVYTGANRLTHRARLRHPAAVLAGRRHGRGFLTGTAELAALAGLPQDISVPGLDRAQAKPVPAPVAVRGGGRDTKPLGVAQVGGHAVALGVADARHHLHLVGTTGSGKTTLMANMIVTDIRAGRGTVVLDPHGDLVVDVLDRLPASVGERVVLFDPDQPNPPALNPLEGDDPDLVVDNIVAIFSSIFAKAWGPRMDDVMRVSCLTLLRHANVTLQHIPPLLNSAQFRSEMTVGLDDPDGLAGFWQWYDEMSPALRAQVIGPVLARLRAFLLRDFVRKTMRYPKASFDMHQILDGGALLVRIPKGILGQDTSRLLGSLILARVWQAATARATLPIDKRRDATVYLDECQNFLTLAGSLDTMLAEARKYRLSMVLAHQDLAQLPREMAAAVSANARNKVFFTVAPEDARQLARHTLPELDEHDLAHLDRYTAAARLIVDGRQTPAFTLGTRAPLPIIGDAHLIRQDAAARVPRQDISAVDELVARLSRRRDHADRTRR